jgi:hypothetical protein
MCIQDLGLAKPSVRHLCNSTRITEVIIKTECGTESHVVDGKSNI